MERLLLSGAGSGNNCSQSDEINGFNRHPNGHNDQKLSQITSRTSRTRPMTHKVARKIYPKISTMPRPQSEASAHLEMYKLLVEKHRLQQELQSLDQRQQQIVERLAALEGQVSQLDATATKLATKLQATTSTPQPAKRPEPREMRPEYNTLFLEY